MRFIIIWLLLSVTLTATICKNSPKIGESDTLGRLVTKILELFSKDSIAIITFTVHA